MPNQIQGIAVSPGVAVASALCLREMPVQCGEGELDESRSLFELVKFETALDRTIVELQAIQQKVAAEVGESEAAIFKAHLTVAQDQSLTSKIRRLVGERRMTVASALTFVQNEYEEVFSGVTDAYLKERLVDVRDVLETIAKNTHDTGDEESRNDANEPSILITQELMPSDVITLTDNNIVGIVTEGGGRTSHAAILARSYGIPAVAGAAGILNSVSGGDRVVVDGTNGQVLVNPGDETARAYSKLQREFRSLRKHLANESSTSPVTTRDGIGIDLCANIGSANEAMHAKRLGAAGIGLYRTEFFYLTHSRIPTEHEQFDEYRRAIDSSPDGPVTIRTLDLGGDKTIPYLAHAPEANPFMGWRSIRLSFEHPQLFGEQIRAILRASHNTQREVRMLFPMITTYDEMVKVNSIVADSQRELDDSNIPFGDVKLGVMIEVPASAIMIRDLLEVVDFVSIGSNDLVQYVTAADRDNPKVSHLCQAWSPAVLRILQSVIEASNEADIPVSVCGEMAGNVRAVPLLLGMGLRTFSMSPWFLPVIRDLATNLVMSDCRELLREAWLMKSSDQVKDLADAFVMEARAELKPYLMD